MMAIRAILQIIFGRLIAMIGVIEFLHPKGNIYSSLGLIGLFVAIILLLGPWWPSPENIEKLALSSKSKFNLPTDDPAVAAKTLGFIMGCVALYYAWSRYSNPSAEVGRKLQLIYAAFGNEGLIAISLLFGFGCFYAAIFKKTTQT